jgi:hypothetical protein
MWSRDSCAFTLLATVLPLALIAPAGCLSNKFEGCKASRTCPLPPDADGGDGAGGPPGEAGAGRGVGGESGSTAGASGEGGGAEGGNSGDTDPPVVVSFTPTDGDVGVQRDLILTVEFSESIYPASATVESVTLTGPEGEVPGLVTVTENVVAFAPRQMLHLLGRYTFNVESTVQDLARNNLDESVRSTFEVRDGMWSTPMRPFGETAPQVATKFQRNEFGDAVLGLETWPNRETVYGAIYQQADARWSSLMQLFPASGTENAIAGAAIDSAQRAVWTWWGETDARWARARDVGYLEDTGTLPGFTRLAVTPAGTAMAISATSSESLPTQTQDLSQGTIEPFAPVTSSDPLSLVTPMVSQERIGFVAVRRSAGREELVVAWSTGTVWSDPEILASAAEIGAFNLDSDELGNVVVVWRQVDEIWARVFERSKDAWTPAAYLMGPAPGALIQDPDITGGNAVVSFNTFDPDPSTWAMVYRSELGWIPSSLIRLDNPYTGGHVAVTMDPQGNALAAWHTTFRSRRFTKRDGWSEVRSLALSINPYYIWGAAARDGSVLVVSNEFAGDGETNIAPWAIRFE